jgi:hypothetical protein
MGVWGGGWLSKVCGGEDVGSPGEEREKGLTKQELNMAGKGVGSPKGGVR